ncbi:hypothetical protein AW835_RS19325, partial [Acinetobacter baumannii]|nr:hypothetical protein [Acinetobacter baumannii]EIB7039393.1 hypothetical protein [Acinetobacter baumannii]HBI9025348.1 hypothetical protein [Acinetobacter baumannii]HBI9053201.1 hypothetical protein [Acinetobacter baumannii]HBI9056981.1 hypothetical protein [Acinetobacter baumannii]
PVKTWRSRSADAYSETVSSKGNNSYFYYYEMPQYANKLLKHNNWRIPRRVINLFCAKQGGTIREGNKYYFEPYVLFPDGEYKSQGTFACKVNNEFVWAVLANATQVQPDGTPSERYRYRFNLTVLPVEQYAQRFLEPQTNEEIVLKNKVDPTFAAKEQQRLDERRKERDAALAKWKDFDKKAIANAPTKNDIGKTICTDSKYIEAMPDKRIVDNVYMTNLAAARFGDIVAKLEDVSPDGKNIKINLRGIGDSSTGQIKVNDKWQYKGMEIKNGTVTWEPSYNWRVCSYI